MKHSMYSLMAVVAISLSFIACQNEQMPDSPKESVRKISVRATQADTRTAVIIDGQGGYQPTWMAGDSISLFEFSPEGVVIGCSEDLEGENLRSVTSFDVDFDDDPEGSPLRYVAGYSPYTSEVYSDDEEWGRETWEQAWGEIPELPRYGLLSMIPQYQKPRDGSFDPDADVMFSQMTGEYQERPTSINLAFARVGSIAKIVLKDLPANDKVVEGNLSFGPSWQATGGVIYDCLGNGKIAVVPNEVYYDQYGQVADEMIDFAFNDEDAPVDLIVDKDGNAVIWLRVFSGTLSDYFSINVKTKDAFGNTKVFVKDVDLAANGKTIKFKENEITSFNVRMESPYKRWYMDFMDFVRDPGYFKAYVKFKKGGSDVVEYGLAPWNGTPLTLSETNLWSEDPDNIIYEFVFHVEEGLVSEYSFMGYIKLRDGTVYYNANGPWNEIDPN